MIKLITAALGLISMGGTIISKLIKPRAKPTNKQRTEKDVHDVRAASAQGNTEKINAVVERKRIQGQMIIPITACLLLAGCSGCSLLKLAAPAEAPEDVPPQTIVISADRYQYPMTNAQGVVGWFVPNVVHAEMMEAVILLDYYKKLK